MDPIFGGNLMENPNLFEGDIMGNPVLKINETHFNAITDVQLLWPKRVLVYSIDSSLSQYQDVIRDAFNYLENKTCIKFKKRTNERDYVLYRNGNGCTSYVGRSGGRQDLTLQIPGCLQKYVIIHESMHALGFYHHQSRSDRDKYVKIHWENIDREFNFAFSKMQPQENSLFVPFDFDSVMLYPPNGFSKNGKETMSSKIPGKRVKMPQEKPVLSEGDTFSIDRLYNCIK
jgi:hypothetical protein